MRPWFTKAISLALALNYDHVTGEGLAAIAKDVGKTARVVRDFLATPWAQAQLAEFHAAVVEKLAARRVEPAVRLAEHRDEAAQVLVAAMRTAVWNGNTKEARESAVAILAHTGDGPILRKHERHEHLVATITDPEILRRIIQTGEVPQLPPTVQ